MKEFIKLLRAAHPQQALMEQAANVIESQSMQIAELEKKYFEDHHCQCGHDDVCEFAGERDALRAELDKLKQQEPTVIRMRTTHDIDVYGRRRVDAWEYIEQDLARFAADQIAKAKEVQYLCKVQRDC